MSGARVTIDVYGEPAPQGSKKIFNGRPVEASKKVGPWREAVVSEVIRSGHADKKLDGPLFVKCVFYFKRPANHYGTRKGQPYLKDTAPQYVARTPDIDKCQRSTYDALTQSGLIVDDALIVMNSNVMLYSDEGKQGARISVYQLTGKEMILR